MSASNGAINGAMNGAEGEKMFKGAKLFSLLSLGIPMIHRKLGFVVGVCLSGMLLSGASSQSDSKVEKLTTYIVKLKPEVLSTFAFQEELSLKGEIQYSEIFNGFSTKISRAEAESLSKDSRVEKLIVDHEVELDEIQENVTWGLSRVDQHNLPLEKTYRYNKTGAGVNVYILDSGVFGGHRDFEGRAQIVADLAEDGQNRDCIGHGTHVAGIIGSKTFGVAKKANIFSVRVFPCGGQGKLSLILAGFDWLAINFKAPAVLNLSIGSEAEPEVDKAVNLLLEKGLTIVGSAGNKHTDACHRTPAGIPGVITVGASDRNDQIAKFSNYGPCVKVFAPGVSIESVYIGGVDITKELSGTSMAAPFVTGVVALLLEQFPKATPKEMMQKIMELSTKGVISESRSEHNDMVFTGVE